MARILINNCGSQAVDIIKLLKEDINNYVVYLTHQDIEKYSMADEVYKDLVFENIKDYVNWLLGMCKEHKIDVFIPFSSMERLVCFKDEFEAQHVKMLINSDSSMFACLNNKVETYKFLGKEFKRYIPLYYEVNNVKELKSAFKVLTGCHKEVCVKYASDIASNSFRYVNFGSRDISELDVKGFDKTRKLTKTIDADVLIDMFTRAYGSGNFEKSLMVMEALTGVEVSCDCLKCGNLDLVFIRKKTDRSVQLLTHDKKIRSVCEKILTKTGYDGPCNIQFIYDADGAAKLLEVNTRMSGGIMLSSYASGVNLPLLAVKAALGEEVENYDYLDTKIITEKSWRFQSEYLNFWKS